MKYKIALLWLSILFVSCAISNTSSQTNEIPTAKSENTIAFVVFKIKKGLIKSNVEIVSSTKTSGTIKRQTTDIPDSSNVLTIELSKNNKIFQTIKINHPLLKSVEFVGPDGKLERKEVALEEDTFFIRFQTMGEATSIKIRESFEEASAQEIANFKL